MAVWITHFNQVPALVSLCLNLELQTNGKVILVGRFSTFDGVSKNRIARLSANGALDLSFNTGTGADDTVNAVAIQSDGNILVGGVFFSLNGLNRAGLGRLEGDPLSGSDPYTDSDSNSNANAIHSVQSRQLQRIGERRQRARYRNSHWQSSARGNS